jgi:hypothetical protein
MNMDAGFNDEAFTTITKSWLGENPTRQRTRTGQYGLEEARESASLLQQTLCRLPTNEELMLDMFNAVGISMLEEKRKTGSCKPM